MTAATGYNVTEVFDGTPMGKLHPTDSFSTYVNPTDVFFGKAVPLASKNMKKVNLQNMVERFNQQGWKTFN